MNEEFTRFELDGRKIDVKCENEELRKKFEGWLIKNYPQYSLWKEKTGKGNWVLYRNDMFEVNNVYLHFKGGMKIELPINCSSCYKMFFTCKLPEGFSLGDKFDTRNVTTMSNMFWGCKFPEGFSFGDKFDTSNVKNMGCMFECCVLPEGFSLGDKFDTSNVTNMYGMFWDCKFPKGFSIGDKFDTSNVTDMRFMFEGCKLPKDFQFPKGYKEPVTQATGF